MSSYPAFTKLLQEHYFEENNQNQMEVGLKLLEYMLFKVAYLKMKDPKYYNLFQERFPALIINQLCFSDKQHLVMCLGKISQTGNYTLLNKIQGQIQKIIKNKSQINNRVRSVKAPSTYVFNKTFDNSKTSFSGFDMQLMGRSNKSEIFKSLEHISQIKRVKNNSFLDDSLQMSRQNFSYQLQPPTDIQTYLKRVQYKSAELNYVKQHFKLKDIQWDQNQQGLQFNVSGGIVIPDLYTNQGDILIKGDGTARKKQAAKQQAAIKILRQLYERYQNIFNQFLQIKKKKNLRT